MLRLVRVGLAAGALLVSAWFGLGWVQARDTGRASALVASGNRLSPGRAGQVRAWLRSAGTLNPDRQVDLLRARLAFDQGAYLAATRIVQSVTRSEPLNVFAWVQLGFTAGAAHQPHLAQLAVTRAAHLVAKLKKR
jgi:hypothetical protein